MDREKLEKGKEEHIKKFGQYWTTIFDVSDVFKSGADWLMQQPLSERLTDAEKDRIRGLLNYVGENAHDSEVRAMRDELTDIFGKDLFNDNPELLK